MTKESKLRDIAIGLILICLTASAAVAQGTAFTYQGKLAEAGNPANGNYDLQFRLFDALLSGVQVGPTVVIDDVPASNGLFIVALDFGANAFPAANRWLEVAVRPGTSAGAYTSLSPLQPINSTPYAIQSLNAATASALSSACVGCVTGAQIGSLPTNSGNYIQNSATLQAASNFNISGNGVIGGNVGIGTSTPLNKLDVNGGAAFRPGGSGGGVIGLGSPNSETGLTVSGNGTNRADIRFDGSSLKLLASTAGIPQPTSGVVIETTGSVGIGVANPIDGYKLHVDSSGAGIISEATETAITAHSQNGYGVHGFSQDLYGILGTSVNSYGVFGESYSISGVYGSSSAASVAHAGVFGRGTGSGSIGVTGSSDLGNAVGVFGVTASPAGFGVYARNLAGGYALYAEGKVHVSGMIEKAGGGFKIDHPLDPENKYLIHSFVESPDMKNLYDGTATTDGNGEAEITLPDWFAALNRDFRYQLTCIGTFAQAIISEEINEGRFKIRTSLPRVKVSWQVTGIRQDAWANENRLPVEELKPDVERGSYQNPSAFGQPEEKSTEWARNPTRMKQDKGDRERQQREQNYKPGAPLAR